MCFTLLSKPVLQIIQLPIQRLWRKSLVRTEQHYLGSLSSKSKAKRRIFLLQGSKQSSYTGMLIKTRGKTREMRNLIRMFIKFLQMTTPFRGGFSLYHDRFQAPNEKFFWGVWRHAPPGNFET